MTNVESHKISFDLTPWLIHLMGAPGRLPRRYRYTWSRAQLNEPTASPRSCFFFPPYRLEFFPLLQPFVHLPLACFSRIHCGIDSVCVRLYAHSGSQAASATAEAVAAAELMAIFRVCLCERAKLTTANAVDDNSDKKRTVRSSAEDFQNVQQSFFNSYKRDYF